MSDKYLKLDWLAFTFKADISVNKTPLEQFLCTFPEFDERIFTLPSFRTCYTNTMLYCDIVVSFNTFDADLSETECRRLWDMGVNVQVSSHCLEMFCSMLGVDFRSEYAFRDLVLILRDRNCKFSRVDVCYDDYDKVFNASYYSRKFEDGLIQTPVRANNVVRFGKSSEGGATIYFGSLKKRNKLLRIYDKYAESNGEYDCVRYEFEYHSDMAMALIDKLLDYEGKLPFIEMLLAVVRIKDADSVSRCARIQDAKLDESWINALNGNLTLNYPIRISPSKSDELSSLNHYIEVQALSSIAGYVKCFGREALYELIKNAIHHGKISPRYMSFYNKLKYSGDLFDTTNPLLDDNPFI